MKGDLELLRGMVDLLYAKKAKNIIVLDIRGISSLTDYMLVADGRVERHVTALMHALLEETKKRGSVPVRSEGSEYGEWIVVDYFSIIVHLFIPEMRERYGPERLWPGARIVDVVPATADRGGADAMVGEIS
ncbi:MAG: ribosome silencing factor [Simkaniaceae bacterium]|nr:ribosome silencing factor [Simkaniaceae bacterium]